MQFLINLTEPLRQTAAQVFSNTSACHSHTCPSFWSSLFKTVRYFPVARTSKTLYSSNVCMPPLTTMSLFFTI